MSVVAAITLALAPAPSVAGLYETHQMEVAAGLELKPNGHFRYALSYGAVDEEAEGDWTFDGQTVRLTSNPMPKAPSFELVRDDPAPRGELWMKLEHPGFEWATRPRDLRFRPTIRGAWTSPVSHPSARSRRRSRSMARPAMCFRCRPITDTASHFASIATTWDARASIASRSSGLAATSSCGDTIQASVSRRFGPKRLPGE